jgi:chromatin remodeling complex protein RSC6
MSKLATGKNIVTKTTKTVKTKKASLKEETETLPETTVPETTVEETTVPETTEVLEAESMRERFDKLIKSKLDLMAELKKEVQELRKMQRDHEHALKDAAKKSKKKKSMRDENNPRKPSGFASPVVVSDELYNFLTQFGVKKSEPIARTDVTKYITTYIKEKDLQNPEYRREILPDATLKKLFGEPQERKNQDDENSPLVYTYLRLQKYLSPHFPKKASA